MEKRIQFTGSGLQALLWGLWAIFLSLLILPAAWGVVALSRWFVSNLAFSDDTEVNFQGRGGDVWVYCALNALLATVPLLLAVFVDNYLGSGLDFVVIFFQIFIGSAICWKLTCWLCSSIVLKERNAVDGVSLEFRGGLPVFMGWYFLLWGGMLLPPMIIELLPGFGDLEFSEEFKLSMLIMLWHLVWGAWLIVAMVRWFCRNINAGHYSFEFCGSGWGLFWRTCVTILPSIFIIPIPWIVVWILRWGMASVVVKAK